MTYADFIQQLDHYAATGILGGTNFWLTCALMRQRHEDRVEVPTWDVLVGKEWKREKRPLTLAQKETVCRFLMETDALSDLAHVFERRVWFDGGLFDFVHAEKNFSTHGGESNGIDFLSMCTAGSWMATIRKGELSDSAHCEITLIADESRPDILDKPAWDAHDPKGIFSWWERMQPKLHGLGIQSFYGRRVDISALLEQVILDWRGFNLQAGKSVWPG